MPSLFKTMAFQLKTERLELSMWEESDSVWLSKLIGERGVDIPAVDSVRNRLIEMRKRQTKMVFPFSLFEGETKAISLGTVA